MSDYDYAVLAGLELSVAITGTTDTELRQHFAKGARQEDLTFAYWRTSRGTKRTTAVLSTLVLPEDGDRVLQGNVAFTAEYLSRVLANLPAGCGIALLHSHLGPGWQDMSRDDVIAERDRLASAVAGRSGLPLVGLTWGTDGTWSARMWGRTAPFTYRRVDVATVRVIGADHLQLSFHPDLRPQPPAQPTQSATVSVWGAGAQADLARTRVGVVGLGSVGSLVTEALGRVGFSDLVLIDHDMIEHRNLDRTLHATTADVDIPKVTVAAHALQDSHTAPNLSVNPLPMSVLTPDGLAAALDCDALVCCVDRPWPRWLLNTIAYAHLIPVVDGGIFARVGQEGRLRHVDWRIHTAGPDRACLICLGALLRSDVALDRDGLLDDPDYLHGLSEQDRERYSRRNVFPFSMSVAAHQTLQLIGMITGNPRVGGIGPQHYLAYPGEMRVEPANTCQPDCETAELLASCADLGADLGSRL